MVKIPHTDSYQGKCTVDGTFFMTSVLITIDTELSAGLHGKGAPPKANIDQSVFAEIDGREFGIAWQMDQLERSGLKGVFFVDPMPELVYGPGYVKRIVEPIVRRGHEVQVHIHTEWLQWAEKSPVDGRQGRSIGDFTLRDQVVLIEWARNALVAAGAPQPTAFRAGNFGANDETPRALSRLGMLWDSSFNPDYVG